MPQHAGSIHVLPPTIADIDGTDFIVASHQSNSISQAAVVSATAGLRSFEIVEDLEWANKYPDINDIVIAHCFPDVSDSISPHSDFHRIFQMQIESESTIHRYSDGIWIKIIK